MAVEGSSDLTHACTDREHVESGCLIFVLLSITYFMNKKMSCIFHMGVAHALLHFQTLGHV